MDFNKSGVQELRVLVADNHDPKKLQKTADPSAFTRACVNKPMHTCARTHGRLPGHTPARTQARTKGGEHGDGEGAERVPRL